MRDFKLFSKCENCRKRRLYIAKRKVKLPIGPVATSQKLLCTPCITKLNNALNK